MRDHKKVADEADVIISGYAIQRCADGIQVINNHQSDGHISVFREDGTLIETSMDDIEIGIARDYMLSALKYMEEYNPCSKID